MNFEGIIGLEIHVEMKTKSKMFSSVPVSFGDVPNTNVDPLDMAMPGAMPTVNKQAVINAIRVCHALHLNIDDELWFDRKNYFYSDLAKGFQITQQKRPIGTNGWLEIEGDNGETKRIDILRLHLEEDTCKQHHTKNRTLLDYNRSGIPLLEIVSKPQIRSGKEAMNFVEAIRSIVTFLDVSDGKMEEGSLRCDVNVSIRPIGSDTYGPKVEIKNISTLNNIQKGIDFEIKRQERVLLSGGNVLQETRRFDETSKETVAMRMKTDEIDYKFFTEPNIVPIKLSKGFINDAIESSPELAEVKMKRYQKLGLSLYNAKLLVANKEISEYYDALLSFGADPKLASNWVIVDIQTVLNKENKTIQNFSITPQNLAKLIVSIGKGEVSNKQGREIFEKMLIDNSDPSTLIKEKGTSLINDEKALLLIINQVLLENPQSIVDYRNGKDKAVGYLVGKVMQLTKGQANPALTNKLIVMRLKGE